MIKAITFDLDGVYFVNGKSNFIAALGRLGVPEDEAKRVFLKSDEMNRLYKEGKMTDDQFWTWALGEWKLDLTPTEIVQLLIDGYEIDPHVAATVTKARAAGYKTLICTNNFKARMGGLQRRFGFLDDFDVVVTSYEVGASKPSPLIFQTLVERSGVQPGEIVFADDNEDNLTGAKSVGIHTFFYRGFEDFMQNLATLGVVL